LILYGTPESISVPQEQDVVRKAILESRERARERAAQQRKLEMGEGEPVPPMALLQRHDDTDDNAMDMDIG